MQKTQRTYTKEFKLESRPIGAIEQQIAGPDRT
jgi:hypothetical protein